MSNYTEEEALELSIEQWTVLRDMVDPDATDDSSNPIREFKKKSYLEIHGEDSPINTNHCFLCEFTCQRPEAEDGQPRPSWGREYKKDMSSGWSYDCSRCPMRNKWGPERQHTCMTTGSVYTDWLLDKYIYANDLTTHEAFVEGCEKVIQALDEVLHPPVVCEEGDQECIDAQNDNNGDYSYE